ncbi:MAG: glycosyltransferase family 2 protein [Candidatus Pacearchaeota archaeon]
MKICLFIPCYYAERTIQKVLDKIPKHFFKKVHEILVIDDASNDKTYENAIKYKIKNNISKIKVIKNKKNLGYGGNQKKAYNYCIKNGFDIVIMLHGDDQYPAQMVDKLSELIEKKHASMVLGSRIKGNPLKNGMPLWRYIFNRLLTFIENIAFGLNLSEYHSGFRAYDCHILKEIDFNKNSDSYVFDQQIVSQIILKKKLIKEITIPTYYGPESHKISFLESFKYGLGILNVVFNHILEYNKRKSSLVYKS